MIKEVSIGVDLKGKVMKTADSTLSVGHEILNCRNEISNEYTKLITELVDLLKIANHSKSDIPYEPLSEILEGSMTRMHDIHEKYMRK